MIEKDRNTRKGSGGHQSARMKNNEWLTPPEIVKALGEFDLDPCAPIERPWPTAKRYFTKNDYGLLKDWGWRQRVWLNPPYGQQTAKWLEKLSNHGNGIAIIFARTETNMFFDYVWDRADGILFIKGRLTFYYVDGTKPKANSGAPSCLIAYGENNYEALLSSGINGKLIKLY